MKNVNKIKCLAVIALLALFIVDGCGMTKDKDGSTSQIGFTWPNQKPNVETDSKYHSPAPSGVNSITLQVTASDITIISTSANISDGSVTVTVPNGSSRKFEAWAYPSNSSTPNYYGSSTVDITGNISITINMEKYTPAATTTTTTTTTSDTTTQHQRTVWWPIIRSMETPWTRAAMGTMEVLWAQH
ncbi:MAG: hypothetical protein HZA00_13545 [Nitrospinae bacterium]|nr:hypothetical protein [Nitrospinota bacterium]